MNLGLSLLTACVCVWCVITARKQAQQQREYDAICKDVINGEIESAVAKARVYLERWS